MAGRVLPAIVLALGAGALGAPDALRLLLQSAGRSPAVDLAICLVVISVVTAHLLGTALLVRFVRKARAGGGAPAATNLLAQATATVSVGAAFLVTACFLAVPGGLGSVRLPLGFAVKNPAVSVLAAVSLPCAVPLVLRFFRGVGRADVPATASKTACLIALSLLAVSFVACTHVFVPGFSWLIPVANMPVSVAAATVAGTTLLVWCSRRARNAAGDGGAAAPTPARYTRRFCKLSPLMAVAVFALACLVTIAYSPPEL